MKRIIIALLCAFTLFSFASCSGDTPAPGPGTDDKAPFEIGNMLSGEFTATTHIEDLYENYPDAMLMQPDHSPMLSVQLASNISYAFSLNGFVSNDQTYTGLLFIETNKSVDPDNPIKYHELERVGAPAN